MSLAQDTRPDAGTVRAWLDAVPDPEIPVLSVNDLGIVREIVWQGDTLVVAITPTYTGCPATAVIALDIETALRAKGVPKVRVERRLSPPWTTDWIGEAARQKLRAYGIAPPEGMATSVAGRLAGLAEAPRAVACPRCGSRATRRVSAFGATPCQAPWVCEACLEPFDHFKCH